MKCPACRADNTPGAVACAACKATLAPSCIGCGALVGDGEELCAACRTDEVPLELDPEDEAAAAGGHPPATITPAVARLAPPPIPRSSAPSFIEDLAAKPATKPARADKKSDARFAARATTKADKKAMSEIGAVAIAHRPRADGGPAGSVVAPRPAETASTSEGAPAIDGAVPAAERTERTDKTDAADRTSAPPGVDVPAPVAATSDARTAAPPAVEEDELGLFLPPRVIGRDEVLDRVRRLVERAAATRTLQFAAMTGTPGVGKSLLASHVAEIVRGVSPEARVLAAPCGGPGAPPFAVFARMLGARFGIAETDTSREARTKIETEVARLIPPARQTEVTHLLARVAGVPFSESSVVDPLTDKSVQLEARTFIAVRRFLMADAERQPLVLVFDDSERARPETVKLIHYLAAGLEERAVVLLLVGRPEMFDVHPSFTRLGSSDAPIDRIDLGPLTPDDSVALLANLTSAAGEAPLAIVRHVRERLAGSPRAIVELVRHLVESGGIKKVGARYAFDRMRFARATLAGGGSSGALPGTLEELVAARLLALEPARRELLEKAAACGETFWLDAMVAIARSAASSDPDGPSLEEIEAGGERTREEVARGLGELEKAGLVVESPHSRIAGEREYHFAYPPWWDVTYKNLSAQARRRYHKLVAQWLELRPERRGEAEAEEVGRHLELAGDGDGAAARFRKAGDLARARYYNEEAIRLYQHALSCVGEGDLATRIQLLHDVGSVQQLKGAYDAAERCFERMLRLAWMVASRPKAAAAFNKLGRLHRQRGNLHRALHHFERGLELFRQADDTRGVAGSLDDIAQTLWLLGRYDEALSRGAAALEARRRLGDKPSIALSLLTIGHIERHRGLFREADACYREAIAIRRDLDDKAGVAACLNGLGALAFQRGDFDGARGQWSEALSLAEEVGQLPLVAILEAHLGEVARALGNHNEARTRFERSRTAAEELDEKRLLSEALRNLASLELANAEPDRARELAQRSFELAEAAGIKVDVGRALITLGEIHAQTLFHDQGEGEGTAEDYFRRAVELFRGIGNEAELGVSLERFGAYRIERGDLDVGKDLLEEAQEIFNRLGMKHFGDAARRVITELE